MELMVEFHILISGAAGTNPSTGGWTTNSGTMSSVSVVKISETNNQIVDMSGWLNSTSQGQFIMLNHQMVVIQVNISSNNNK